MNAAETIEAAIDRLTELRDEATPGTWKAGRRDGELGWFVAGAYGDFLTTGYVGNRDSKPTAEIIATLHRTIDAQLAILRFAQSSIAQGFHDRIGGGLALAEAILGANQ